MDLEPPSNYAFKQFKELLLNQPASAPVCGTITSHQLSKLACSRWLTEELLEGLANIVNKSSDDCLCLVLSEYNKRQLGKYTATSLHDRSSIRLAFFIVNVSIDPLSGTAIASNQLLTGNHWTVIATDFDSKLSYYVDSLGYPVPSNLIVEIQPVFDHRTKKTPR